MAVTVDDARQEAERKPAGVAGVVTEGGAAGRREGMGRAAVAGGGAGAVRGAGRASPAEGDPSAGAAAVRVGHAGVYGKLES